MFKRFICLLQISKAHGFTGHTLPATVEESAKSELLDFISKK